MEVTRRLARYVAGSRATDIPPAVRHEATRSLVNWLGCALGGSRHEAVTIALNALQPFAGPPQAGVIGRRERLDSLHAALINGMSAHVLDFDDTHLRTLMHPSVPVASSLLALAERRPLSGEDFLHAFVLGVEVECRVANAIYFAHNYSSVMLVALRTFVHLARSSLMRRTVSSGVLLITSAPSLAKLSRVAG